MKSLKLIGMILVTVFMYMNLSSCSDEKIMESPQSPQTIEVSLKAIGEILDITEMPLSKAAGSDLYAVQVNQNIKIENGNIRSQSYAYGVFTDLTLASIKLTKGTAYDFKVSMVVDGQNKDFKYHTQSKANYDYDKFNYTDDYIRIDEVEGQYVFDRYLGLLNDYIPTEDGTAEIYMKRTSYGAEFVATNIEEGTIDIDVNLTRDLDLGEDVRDYSLTLTPEQPSNDNIYSFSYLYNAYDTDNYSETKYTKFTWTKANGDIVDLGTHEITFKRNVKTKIKITLEQTYNKGLVITKEDNTMADDDNEYNIEQE